MNDDIHLAYAGYWCPEFKDTAKFSKLIGKVTCAKCIEDHANDLKFKEKHVTAHSKLFFKTPEAFKEKVKVGDAIVDSSTGKKLIVTAIGDTRILIRDEAGSERVSLCVSVCYNWRLVE